MKKKVLVKSYPSLRNDSVFKYLFKNKETRSYFDKLVYETTKIDISRYKLIDQELNSGNKKKDYRLDILLEKEDTIINIELNSKYNEYVQNKSKAYIYRIAGYLYNEGEQYKNKNIIQINYNYALLKGAKDAILKFKFRDKKYKYEKEGITIYDVYVENYKGICYNGNNLKETLLSVFNAKSREELIRIGNKNKEVEKLMDNLEKLLTSEEFYNLFDYEKERKRELNYYKDKGIEIGEKRGEKRGMRFGIEKTKKENALNLLKEDVDINIISKCTGLSIKDVNKLRNSLN